METIRRSTNVEDLVREYPTSVRFMVAMGLPCMTCGEPFWGTFEDLARQSGKHEAAIDALVDELNTQIGNRGGDDSS